MCVSGGGEEKRKVRGTWVVGEKKEKEIGSGVYMYGGKKERVEKKEEKKIARKKTKLVIFVYSLCLV